MFRVQTASMQCLLNKYETKKLATHGWHMHDANLSPIYGPARLRLLSPGLRACVEMLKFFHSRDL